MANMTNVNIRMDANLKKQVEELFNDFGINMTTAMTMFAKAVVRERKIPFEIASIEDDGFYNDYNIRTLTERIKDIENGNVKYIYKTMEELEAMERE